MKSNPLRHPGQGIQPAECDADEARFKQPLIDIMAAGEVFKTNNSHASDEEYSDALERRSLRICKEAEVPTLHKAVTTSEELRTWIQERVDGTTFMNIQLLVLERFIWQSEAKTRVITSLTWMCNNLGLNWRLHEIEKRVVGKSAGALGMEAKQTPAAQPMMYNHLEDEMKPKCENGDPTWPALLGSWLQCAGCPRLGHIIRRSAPVERFDGWVLFFCKRGKQSHNRQGF